MEAQREIINVLEIQKQDICDKLERAKTEEEKQLQEVARISQEVVELQRDAAVETLGNSGHALGHVLQWDVSQLPEGAAEEPEVVQLNADLETARTLVAPATRRANLPPAHTSGRAAHWQWPSHA